MYRGVPIFQPPGKPMQNGVAEAFSGRMRDAALDETLFLGIDRAREAVAEWVMGDHTDRPLLRRRNRAILGHRLWRQLDDGRGSRQWG